MPDTTKIDEKLVSIISPCYNGESFVHRFLDSVLAQDYPNIEVIFIDDGSTDSTARIVQSYIPKFAEQQYSLQYYYQINRGQAAAINNGLTKIQGAYLMCMDSDDMLLPTAISEKVEYLESHPQIDLVICQGFVVKESDTSCALNILRREHNGAPDNLFQDLIDDRNVTYTPAAYLTRTSAFFEAIPSRHIYDSREGQNSQLLLPLAHNAAYGYIDKPLFKYVMRANSHSRGHRDYEALRQRQLEAKVIKTQTICEIPHMGEEEKEKWISRVSNNCNIWLMEVALNHYRIHDWFSIYKHEKNLGIIWKYNPLNFYMRKIINHTSFHIVSIFNK